jgi:pilus assembly protein CpaC
MTSDRAQNRPKITVCVAAALLSFAPASSGWAADSNESMRLGSVSDPGAKTLQLGVGKSVIVDLPEEAGEIYVGDPKIANAIVRSARRVYVSGVANGQTSARRPKNSDD